MKRKSIIIILIIVILLVTTFLGYHLFSCKEETLNGIEISYYVESTPGSDNYTSQNTVPIGNYYISDKTICINGGRIYNYNKDEGTIYYDIKGSDRCYVYFEKYEKTLVQLLQDQQTSSANFNSNLSSVDADAYLNLRYTGRNPNNYISYNGELWRIIGLFNEDSTGLKDPLVKIINNSSLGDMAIDLKKFNTGSKTDTDDANGSGDWSDMQIMYMLNGLDYVNTARKSDGRILHQYCISTTCPTGGISDGTTTIYKLYNNTQSYLNGGSTLCKPEAVTMGGTFSCSSTVTVAHPLSLEAQNMIQEVLWHLGGPTYTSANDYQTVTGAKLYTGERGTFIGLNGINTNFPYKWVGKVGLMYASDYIFAAKATASGVSCAGPAYNWGQNGTTTNNCAYNDWLLYTDSTSSTVGTASQTWAMTLSPSSGHGIFVVKNSSGYTGWLSHNGLSYVAAIRPVVYLKNNIVVLGGTGTSSDPFILKLPTY